MNPAHVVNQFPQSYPVGVRVVEEAAGSIKPLYGRTMAHWGMPGDVL